MSVSLSNQVCDNLRIDETSVHTIIVQYGEALNSLFYSQGRSLVRKESVTQYDSMMSGSIMVAECKYRILFFNLQFFINNFHFLISPGTIPYSSLKHLVK